MADPKPDPQPTTPPPADETDSERDNRELADKRVDPADLADHDGVGGKGRMPDAQALTRPGPGDPVPTPESVVDPDRPAAP